MTILASLLAAALSAQPAPQVARPNLEQMASAECYRLEASVRSEGGEGRPWASSQQSFVSEPLLPNIHGIMVPWSYKGTYELLWLDGLKLKGGELDAKVSLEINPPPIDSHWIRLWSKRRVFRVGREVPETVKLQDRLFHVSMTLKPEPDRARCSLPAMPPLPRSFLPVPPPVVIP